jgi:EAL domain-containing protein (putative c-di-GMP-specific phosphodiesterase class I)
VIVRAIEMLAKLQAAGRSTAIEVNVSGRSLGDPSLMAAIEATLARTGADPSGLILEITETAAVANIPQAQAFGQRLSELGCRFALDDFGAGFGSFYYLKHLPFDILKIDGEFVRNCRANPVDRLVIESVVTIARGMGKQTVAEFVGDDDTVDLLRSYGVDLAQGFHLGRPGPLDDMLVVQPQRNPTGVSSGSSGLTGSPATGSSAS